MGALPGLTGLLVHDALRGPLPPSEETAVMTLGKIWALGLVCVKLWARYGAVCPRRVSPLCVPTPLRRVQYGASSCGGTT